MTAIKINESTGSVGSIQVSDGYGGFLSGSLSVSESLILSNDGLGNFELDIDSAILQSSSNFFNETSLDSISASGSVSFSGDLGSNHSVSDVGSNVSFFVSGSIGGASENVAVFGGDVVISGSLSNVTLDSLNISSYGLDTKEIRHQHAAAEYTGSFLSVSSTGETHLRSYQSPVFAKSSDPESDIFYAVRFPYFKTDSSYRAVLNNKTVLKQDLYIHDGASYQVAANALNVSFDYRTGYSKLLLDEDTGETYYQDGTDVDETGDAEIFLSAVDSESSTWEGKFSDNFAADVTSNFNNGYKYILNSGQVDLDAMLSSYKIASGSSTDFEFTPTYDSHPDNHVEEIRSINITNGTETIDIPESFFYHQDEEWDLTKKLLNELNDYDWIKNYDYINLNTLEQPLINQLAQKYQGDSTSGYKISSRYTLLFSHYYENNKKEYIKIGTKVSINRWEYLKSKFSGFNVQTKVIDPIGKNSTNVASSIIGNIKFLINVFNDTVVNSTATTKPEKIDPSNSYFDEASGLFPWTIYNDIVANYDTHLKEIGYLLIPSIKKIVDRIFKYIDEEVLPYQDYGTQYYDFFYVDDTDASGNPIKVPLRIDSSDLSSLTNNQYQRDNSLFSSIIDGVYLGGNGSNGAGIRYILDRSMFSDVSGIIPFIREYDEYSFYKSLHFSNTPDITERDYIIPQNRGRLYEENDEAVKVAKISSYNSAGGTYLDDYYSDVLAAKTSIPSWDPSTESYPDYELFNEKFPFYPVINEFESNAYDNVANFGYWASRNKLNYAVPPYFYNRTEIDFGYNEDPAVNITNGVDLNPSFWRSNGLVFTFNVEPDISGRYYLLNTYKPALLVEGSSAFLGPVSISKLYGQSPIEVNTSFVFGEKSVLTDSEGNLVTGSDGELLLTSKNLLTLNSEGITGDLQITGSVDITGFGPQDGMKINMGNLTMTTDTNGFNMPMFNMVNTNDNPFERPQILLSNNLSSFADGTKAYQMGEVSFAGPRFDSPNDDKENITIRAQINETFNSSSVNYLAFDFYINEERNRFKNSDGTVPEENKKRTVMVLGQFSDDQVENENNISAGMGIRGNIIPLNTLDYSDLGTATEYSTDNTLGNSRFRWGGLHLGEESPITFGNVLTTKAELRFDYTNQELAFSGSTRFDHGLTGSLTKLIDGTSYIRGIEGVTVTTGSKGEINISLADYSTSPSIDVVDKITYANVSGSTIEVNSGILELANYSDNLLKLYNNGQLLISGSLSDISNDIADYTVNSLTNEITFADHLLESDILSITYHNDTTDERGQFRYDRLFSVDQPAGTNVWLNFDFNSVDSNYEKFDVFVNGQLIERITGAPEVDQPYVIAAVNRLRFTFDLLTSDVLTLIAKVPNPNTLATGGDEEEIESKTKHVFKVTQNTLEFENTTITDTPFDLDDYDKDILTIYLNGILQLPGSDYNVNRKRADYIVTGPDTIKFSKDIYEDDIIVLDLVMPGYDYLYNNTVFLTANNSLLNNTLKLTGSSGIGVETVNETLVISNQKELVFNEILSGEADGSNKIFSLNFAPFSSSEISIFVNGQLQCPVDEFDYYVNDQDVIFSTSATPPSGSLVMAIYNRVV